jgi:glycosyltransferase involved in cell wall biosynthesis
MKEKIAIVGGYGPSLSGFRGPLIKGMIACGHEVVGIAPDDDSRTQARLAELGARFVPIALKRASSNIAGDIHYYRDLKRIFAAEKPDIVFSYTVKPVIYGSLAARSVGVPKVYSMMTGLGHSYSEGGGPKRRLLRIVVSNLLYQAFKRCDGVFFHNPDDLAELRKSRVLRKDAKAYLVAGSGVDTEKFAIQPLPPLDAEHPLTFSLVARLIEEKGILEYAEALREIKKTYAVKGILVAHPDANPSAIPVEKAREWHKEGLLEFIEGTDDVRPYLKESHVFVLPSYREGTPRSVLEAMAVGRAVITTDSPGCRETVPLTSEGVEQKRTGEAVMRGRNGFLVRPRDSRAIVIAMEQFIENPSLVETMRAESQRLTRTKFDARLVTKAMLDVILPGEMPAVTC